MSDPFIAEIRIFAGNFAPRSWAFCDGQLLPISQNTTLFSLIGTTYGGDGRTTTALPDLKGRAPMHPEGQGPSDRRLGESSGTEWVTLTETQMPNHTHTQRAVSDLGNTKSPEGNVYADTDSVDIYQTASTSNLEAMDDNLQSQGGSQQHNNMQPYLTVNFIIALQGTYPSRS